MVNINYNGQYFTVSSRPDVKLYLDKQIGRFDLLQTADLLLKQYPMIGYDLLPNLTTGDESKVEFPPQSILLHSHLSGRENCKTEYCSVTFGWINLVISNPMLSSVKVEHWGDGYEVEYSYSLMVQIPMEVKVLNSECGYRIVNDLIATSAVVLSYKSNSNWNELELLCSHLELKETIGSGLVVTGRLMDSLNASS
jgi:hypothetical protein